MTTLNGPSICNFVIQRPVDLQLFQSLDFKGGELKHSNFYKVEHNFYISKPNLPWLIP